MTDNSRASLVAGLSLRTLSRAALGCMLGVTLLAAAAPARAADGDDNENVPLDTKIIRGFMEQLGLRQDGPGIAYGERPPLVIPPNHDLPPPERIRCRRQPTIRPGRSIPTSSGASRKRRNGATSA